MRKNHTLRTELLATTLSVMILVISVSLIVFLLFIKRTLGDYVQNTMDFTMETINETYSDKFKLIEMSMLSLRNDPDFFSYLDQPSSEVGQQRFAEDVDIYSDVNLTGDRLPFLESIYLFTGQGGFFHVLYYDIPEREKLLVDERMATYADMFVSQGSDRAFFHDEEYLYYVSTLFDENMDSAGTLLYAMNVDTLQKMLDTVTSYEGAFYVLSDPSGDVVFSHEYPQGLNVSSPHLGPFNASHGSNEYRMYSGEVGFGLHLLIGIPFSIISNILFSSTRVYLIALVLLLLLFSVGLFLFITRLTKPLPEIARQLEKVTNKDFTAKLPSYRNREFYLISHTFNDMTEMVNHLITDVYEKELLATKNELQFLQSQMNPHFMYNVLNSFALKARFDGNEELSSKIAAFTSLIQARLQQQGNTKISIADELSLVRFYLELQHYRFQDKLSYTIEYEDESLLDALVPRLLIEFAVENAVVHGIEPKDTPGCVTVHVRYQGDDIAISIEDDGVGFKGSKGDVPLPYDINMTPSSQHSHVAMNNSYRLVSYYYDPPYGMHIESTEGEGTIVRILLPYERRV